MNTLSKFKSFLFLSNTLVQEFYDYVVLRDSLNTCIDTLSIPLLLTEFQCVGRSLSL